MHKRTQRWALWGIAAAILAALLIVGVATFRSVRAAAVTAEACADVTATNQLRDDSVPVSDGELVAVVLGDSYAQGQYLDDPRAHAWSTRLGETEGWRTFVNAIGGTGYTTDGPCDLGETLLARVPDVLSHDPAVVVVQAGLNDGGLTVTDVEELLTALSAVPRVVIVGPTSPPNYDAEVAAAIDRTLGIATGAAGREYVSMLGLDASYLSDGKHLDIDGHEEYASFVFARLARG